MLVYVFLMDCVGLRGGDEVEGEEGEELKQPFGHKHQCCAINRYRPRLYMVF